MNRNECEEYLMHYGTPRHSGRYPYGSGERPKQNSKQYMERAVSKVKAVATAHKEASAAKSAQRKAARKEVVNKVKLNVKAKVSPWALTDSEVDYLDTRSSKMANIKKDPTKQTAYKEVGQIYKTQDYKNAAKNSSMLSDDELTQRIARLQKEKQLKDLTASVTAKPNGSVQKIIQKSAESALADISKKAITYAVGAGLKSSGHPEAAKAIAGTKDDDKKDKDDKK